MDEQSIPSNIADRANSYEILFRVYSEEEGIDLRSLYSADKILKGVVVKEQIYTDFFDDIDDITQYRQQFKAKLHRTKTNSKAKQPKSNSPSSIKLVNFVSNTEDQGNQTTNNLPHITTHQRRSCSQYDPKLIITSTDSLEVSPLKQCKSQKNSFAKESPKKLVKCNGIQISSRAVLPDDIFASNYYSPSLMCSINSSAFVKHAESNTKYLTTKDEAINVDLGHTELVNTDHCGRTPRNQSIEFSDSKGDNKIDKPGNNLKLHSTLILAKKKEEPSLDLLRMPNSERKAELSMPKIVSLCSTEGKVVLSEINRKLKKKSKYEEDKARGVAVSPTYPHNRVFESTSKMLTNKKYKNLDQILEEAKDMMTASKKKKKCLKLPQLKKSDPYSLASSNKMLENYFNIKIVSYKPD